ncbi:MAG: hypothetical protein RML12_11420 [Xanthomonadales bacterium]|nr:hypothetical protein [Xanthomonadales bacterium]
MVAAESQAQLERLATRLRQAERGEDVARGAIARLQGLLGEQQAEIARLRADLAFFERLTAPEGERRGMAIHGLDAASARVGGLTWCASRWRRTSRPRAR